MTEKTYISWDDFHRDVKELSVSLKNKRAFNRIIAISRGGLLPAGILAYELDIRNVDSLNIVSYDGSAGRKDEDVEIKNSFENVDAQTLIVDDLADSGRTLKILRQKYPQAFLAVVYAKPSGRDIPDMYSRALPDNWVVFPWD